MRYSIDFFAVLAFLGVSYGGGLESYSYVKCKAAVLSGDFGLSGTVHVAENGSLLQVADLSDIQGDLYPYCKANCGLGSNFNNFHCVLLPRFVMVSPLVRAPRPNSLFDSQHRTGFLRYDSYRWGADHGLAQSFRHHTQSVLVGKCVCSHSKRQKPENGLQRFSTTLARF
jgi:hypothetical protein